MQQKIKIITVLVFLGGSLFAFTRTGQTQTNQTQTKQVETAGQKFKNIKVLNDMPADQMGKVMNLMAASLGVNCNFCHVGNDFEKDGNQHKEAARKMIKMTFDLNKLYFDARPEVSCNTCHGGRSHPVSAPSLVPNTTAPPSRPDPNAARPTIDQLLDKYTQALGGRENLAKITSRHVKASRLEPDGKTSEPEEVWQKADKVLVTTAYGDYVVAEAFDGKQVWKTGNKDLITLKPDEAEQVKRNAQILAFADLKTVYARLDVRSADKIDGRDVYLVTATNVDNSRERLYFDAQTGLLIRRIASTPTILGAFQYQVDFSDYKDFDGVKLPVTTRFAVPGISWTRKILEVKSNAPIDDGKYNSSTK